MTLEINQGQYSLVHYNGSYHVFKGSEEQLRSEFFDNQSICHSTQKMYGSLDNSYSVRDISDLDEIEDHNLCSFCRNKYHRFKHHQL